MHVLVLIHHLDCFFSVNEHPVNKMKLFVFVAALCVATVYGQSSQNLDSAFNSLASQASGLPNAYPASGSQGLSNFMSTSFQGNSMLPGSTAMNPLNSMNSMNSLNSMNSQFSTSAFGNPLGNSLGTSQFSTSNMFGAPSTSQLSSQFAGQYPGMSQMSSQFGSFPGVSQMGSQFGTPLPPMSNGQFLGTRFDHLGTINGPPTVVGPGGPMGPGMTYPNPVPSTGGMVCYNSATPSTGANWSGFL